MNVGTGIRSSVRRLFVERLGTRTSAGGRAIQGLLVHFSSHPTYPVDTGVDRVVCYVAQRHGETAMREGNKKSAGLIIVY